MTCARRKSFIGNFHMREIEPSSDSAWQMASPEFGEYHYNSDSLALAVGATGKRKPFNGILADAVRPIRR